MPQTLSTASRFALSAHHLTMHYYRMLLRKQYVSSDILEHSMQSLENKGKLVASLRKGFAPFLIRISDSDWSQNRRNNIISKKDYSAEFNEELDDVHSNQCSFKNILNLIAISRIEAKRIFTDIVDARLKSECTLKAAEIRSARRREDSLRTFFGLNYTDLEILRFCVAFEADLYEFCRSINSFGESLRAVMKTIAHCTGLPLPVVKQAFSKNGDLLRKGLIEMSGRSTFGGSFSINESVMEFVSGIGEADNLMDMYIRRDRTKALPISAFDIKEQHSATMVALLSLPGPVNILLHGAAGTGKTEFARSLAHAAGKRPVFAVTRLFEKGSNIRSAVLEPAMNLITEYEVLIIDEADDLINQFRFFGSQGQDKGWLNEFVDKSRAKIIWITNETGYVPESHLRRFSYSMAFKPFTESTRRAIWQSALRKTRLRSIITPQIVESLANEYQVNAAGIASACDAAARMLSGGNSDAEAIVRTVRAILDQHQELISGGGRPKEKLFSLTGSYQLDFINTSQPISTVLEPLMSIAERIRNGDEGEYNANLLFYGIPGTGKTELVKYLGTRLKMKVIFKRASDLLSPFVGMTERRLNEAFREAEDERKILFIDEADTFFRERTGNSLSWEISQINELLTQMENFRGIFICCTNMKTLIDQAALRRFNWKVEFLPLRGEQVEDVFTAYYPGQAAQLSLSQKQLLRQSGPFTLGDFRAVANTIKFRDAATVSADELVTSLCREAEHRSSANNKQIGFSA